MLQNSSVWAWLECSVEEVSRDLTLSGKLGRVMSLEGPVNHYTKFGNITNLIIGFKERNDMIVCVLERRHWQQSPT